MSKEQESSKLTRSQILLLKAMKINKEKNNKNQEQTNEQTFDNKIVKNLESNDAKKL
jgi:hypothetical protein